MPLNPLIPLSGDRVNFGQIVESSRQRKADNRHRDALLDIAKAHEARDQQRFEAEQQRQINQQEFESMVTGAVQVRPLLDKAIEAGDQWTLRQFLSNRMREIEARGGDPQDTREIMDLVNAGDLEHARELVDVTIRAGQLHGLVGNANGQAVQSTQILENGNLALVFRDGSIEDTGMRARGFAQRPIETGQGIVSFDPGSGGTGQVLSPAQEITATEAARAGEVVRSQETARTNVETQTANAQAQESKREVAAQAQRALEAPGLRRVFGSVQGAMSAFRFRQDVIDAEAEVDKLVAMLSLDSREKMKGSGAVSDFESRLLGEAATILSSEGDSADRAIEALSTIAEILGTPNREAASGSGTETTELEQRVERLRREVEALERDPLGIRSE